MPLICTCLQGHRWEHAGPSAPDMPPPACPQCGAPAAALFEADGPAPPAPAAAPAPFDPVMLTLEPVREGAAGRAPPPTVLPVPEPRAPGPPARPPQPSAARPHPQLPQRPRSEPPPRSIAGPVILAVVLTLVVCALVVAVGAVIWAQNSTRDREQQQVAVWRANQVEMNARKALQDVIQQQRQAEEEAQRQRQAAEQAHAQAQRQVADLLRKLGDGPREAAALAAERMRREQAEAQLRDTVQKLQQLQQQQRTVQMALLQLQKLQQQPPKADPEVAKLRREAADAARALKDAQAGFAVKLKAHEEATAAATYAHCIALAQWEALAGHPERVADYLRECPPSRRRWEWHYLARVYGAGPAAAVAVKGPVRGLGFSADGKRVAVAAGLDGTVTVRDLASGAELASAAGWPRKVARVVFSPGGDRFAASCVTSSVVPEIKVYDFGGGAARLLHELKPGGECLALSRDGKRLAASDQRRGVVIWDVDAGKELHVLPRARGATRVAAFSPDGSLLATASYTLGPRKANEPAAFAGEITVYSVADGKPVLALKPEGGRPTALAFAPDGKLLASATADRVQLWDTSARAVEAPARTLPEDGARIQKLAFSPDGKRLFAGAFDGLVRIYEMPSGRRLRGIQAGVRQVFALAVSPDGTRLAVGGLDPTVRVWPAAPRPAGRLLKGHAGPVEVVAFSPDGARLASAGADKTVRVWDAAGGRELHVLQGHTRAVSRAVFSPDGKRLATVSVPAAEGGREVEVKVWDAEKGEAVCSIAGFAGDGVGVAFDPSGKRLGVTAPGKGLKVYDPQTGKEAAGFEVHGRPLLGQRADVLAVSPGGQNVAYGDRTSVMMTVATPHGARTVKLMGQLVPATGLAWSANGQRLAAASGGRAVTIWNADPPSRLGTVQGNRLDLRRAALSADGQRLATPQGPQVTLWELAPPKAIFTLPGHAAPVTGVAFSPDGSRLATGAADGTVMVWDATPANAAAAR